MRWLRWKSWKFWVIVGAGLFVLLIIIGSLLPVEEETITSPSRSQPVRQSESLADKFGCQWIMDEFRPMTMAGRDAANMHVSNAMNIKGGFSPSEYVSVGDAAQAIRTCESRGYE